MKLTAPVSSIAAALAVTIAAVEKRNTIPILSHVLLNANGNRLTITASDLDLEVTTHVAANIESEGVVTANAATLMAALKKFAKTGEVSLESATGHVVAKSGRSRIQISSLAADEFPRMPDADYPANITCGSADIARLIGKTIFVASSDPSKYYLCGVYLHTDNGMMSASATDGHRLAYATSPVPFDMPGVILPSKAAAHVLRLLDGTNFPVDVSVSETRVRFVFGETVITTKLVDGSFPDYKRVIPSDITLTATCEASELARIIDTVSIVASERSNACTINISDGVVCATMYGSDNQRAEDQTEIECDGDYSIKFNSRYILDTLSHIDGNATIGFMENTGPVTVRDDADPDAVFVVMPLRE